ncbi:addiction module antitoxin, RelB/DinJ family [Selenomonas artemidis F0399]|uniref:Addiction module antitoxin, RelB/DinJ family n=2 Tax=Selenomonadaceae TaxID=1843491 RepID=E7N128_9FIRM|nr:addiction module antitoxin, RelB/DinJ family [Selenomonas artemidis F0399]
MQKENLRGFSFFVVHIILNRLQLFSFDDIMASKEDCSMANALVQFRADEHEKMQAIDICARLGMDLPSYLRMCMSRLVSERGIPFRMHLDDSPTGKGLRALHAANRIAAQHGTADMSLDEINAEISAARM